MSRKAFSILVKIMFVGVAGVFLSGCEQANSETKASVATPVKIYQIPEIGQIGYDLFLAEVDAGQRSQLSFQVPGVVDELHVKEGQKVSKGDKLARLDASDYQLALDAATAQFDLQKTRFLRDEQLFKKGLISADAFDQTETAYKAADAKLEQAKTDLGFTTLTAPFDGVVSLKFVQPFQYVVPNQSIVNIINNDHLDINISIPVPYVEKVGIHNLVKREYAVMFDLDSSIIVPAEFKEMSTQPNVDTNSYSATVTILRPKQLNILKGMTGQVLIANEQHQNSLSVPNDAWISKQADQGKIWRFNPETNTIESVTVRINEVGSIESGLSAGDKVIVAGAKDLKEGQTVRAWTREGGI